MAVPLHAPCGRPLFLPPGYTGALCDCQSRPQGHSQAPAAAPSPAMAAPGGPSLRVSEGLQDGGGRARDGASGSPGRGREERPQPSPQAPRGAIEAAPKPEGLSDDYKPDRDAQERAEGWFKAKFFKAKGIGDEWKKIVAACKTWGMPDKVKWRDWLKEQWESNRAVAVKVLITAGEIPGPTGKPDPSSLTADLRKLYDYLKAHPNATLADCQAGVDPKVSQANLDALFDLGMVYEPILGKWAVV